jgi:molybdopterin-guanine dinucleotide biosynthesis protein A
MVEKIHTGIVLAGGKSSRMREDKGMLPWHGKTLAQHSVEIIASFCAEILISSNNRYYEFLGYPVHADQYRYCGPMGGILTCLHHSGSARNLVIPVDTPLVSPGLYRRLLREEGTCDLVVPVDHDSWYQPLVAVYHKSIIPAMEEQVRNGILGFTPLIRRVRSREVFFRLGDHEYGPMTFFNINTPADLEAIS